MVESSVFFMVDPWSTSSSPSFSRKKTWIRIHFDISLHFSNIYMHNINLIFISWFWYLTHYNDSETSHCFGNLCISLYLYKKKLSKENFFIVLLFQCSFEKSFCSLRQIHLTKLIFKIIAFSKSFLALQSDRKRQILKHLIHNSRDILCLTAYRIIPVGNDAVLCCLDFFGVVNHFVQYFSWFCILNKLMLQNQIKEMSNSLIPVTYHKTYIWVK